jgi:hypothetical protein
MLWIVVPSLVAQGGVTIRIMNYILLAFLFQYIPKLLHLVLVGRRLQRVTGYIFGTAYSGFVLNLAAYFSAAHVSKSKASLHHSLQILFCFACRSSTYIDIFPLVKACAKIGKNLCLYFTAILTPVIMVLSGSWVDLVPSYSATS